MRELCFLAVVFEGTKYYIIQLYIEYIDSASEELAAFGGGPKLRT